MVDVKRGETLVVVGTRKGLFLFHSRDRKKWSSRGPYFEGDEIRHAILDPFDGKTVYAGATSEHWGPIVARTKTFGGKWSLPHEGPRFSKESGVTVTRTWQLQATEDSLYAGVEPAGLFRSDDEGETWSSVDALNYESGREKWEPGGGGLCLHTILPYPGDRRRMLVAISAAGLFTTNDSGKSWRRYDAGIRYYGKQKFFEHEDLATCPHKLARDARDPAVLYMQNHAGMYRRARGDAAWQVIEKGLPTAKSTGGTFGFPVAAHPHDAQSAFAVPLVGDYNRVTPNGAMAVYKTTNGGKQWSKRTKGLPQSGAWFTVLRDGLRTDTNDPAGIYVGTTTGQLYASRDDGESWSLMADHLPPIQSVEAGVVGGH